MTREEAKAFAEKVIDLGFKDETQEFCEFVLKLLEKEPCEDAISRQAMLALAGNSVLDLDDYEDCEHFLSQIRELPPVAPQQKMGHWIAVENEEMETVGYYCSECDLPMETEQRTNFCPNCGAKMRGEQ